MQRERLEDAMQLALKTEEGARTQGMQVVPRSWGKAKRERKRGREGGREKRIVLSPSESCAPY